MALPGDPPPAPPPGGAGDECTWNIRRWIWLTLAVSFALRAWIAWRGGQLFWPDEDRFDAARRVARTLFEGNVRGAVDALLSHSDHLLFKVASLLPASLEILIGTPGWVSALFFGLASTWVLWLVARVARSAGASETESLIALLLAAGTTSLFYYSRHYFPYDLSLGFLLLSLLAGLREPATRRSSFCAGIWACLGFLCYNGYWTLAGAALVTHVLRAFPRPGEMARRAARAAIGLLLPMLLVAAASRLLGHDFLASAVAFAGTVNQGDPGQAWKFVPQYLWVTEHGLAVLWFLAILATPVIALRSGGSRVLFWPAFSLLLLALLILPSDLVGRFALSARHVRVLAPFLCLAAASTLYSLAGSRRLGWFLPLVLVLVGVQAGFNLLTPLTQVFPREFVQMADRHLRQARGHDLGPYAVLNCDFLHNPDWVKSGPDAGEVRLQRNHPFQFLPYLYEGYPAVTRDRYLAQNPSMRVVRLTAGGRPRTGHPAGPIELTLKFPENPNGLLPEPILATGHAGRGDLIFIRYEGPHHFRIGHDHIGGGAVLSEIRHIDRSKPHRLLINMGSLHPATSASNLLITWDNEVLLNTAAVFHPSAGSEIDLGHNFLGFTTAIPLLSADVTAVKWAVQVVPGQPLADYPGALQLVLSLPDTLQPLESVPLLSTGRAEHGDLLFLRHEGGGLFRVGHDHWGGGATWSEPFPLNQPANLNLLIAADGLAAPVSPAAATTRPQRLLISCNGQVVFNRPVTFHPTRPGEIVAGVNRVGSSAAPARHPARFLLVREIADDFLFPRPSLHPAVVRMRLQFHGPTEPGRTEPILSTGRSGAGDILFVRHEDSGHIRIGCDHWGRGIAWSDPLPFDHRLPLNLTIAMGSLLPPVDNMIFQQNPPWLKLKDRLFVMAGDTVILDRIVPFHPAAAGTVEIGVNAIGASSCAETLSADLLGYQEASPAEILPLLDRP